jgi:putative hemolysin
LSDGQTTRKHIVDVLLEERAPHLMCNPLWPLLRPPLFALLDYRGARRIADAIAAMHGREALSFCRDLLHLDVRVNALDRIPPSGRCLIAANHPTGIADGVAVSEALAERRPDHCFFANADALRVCPGLADVIIPVEWVEEKRTIEKTRLTLRMAQKALWEERAVVIFPAGAPARRIKGVIQEPPWERAVVTLARKHEAPIIPIRVSGPFSLYYHAFDLVSRELRNLTLFREFLNKAGHRFDLSFGRPIAPEALAGDASEITRCLRLHVVRDMARNADQSFS